MGWKHVPAPTPTKTSQTLSLGGWAEERVLEGPPAAGHGVCNSKHTRDGGDMLADPGPAPLTTLCSPTLALEPCREDSQDSPVDWQVHFHDVGLSRGLIVKLTPYFRISTSPIQGQAPNLQPQRRHHGGPGARGERTHLIRPWFLHLDI